MTATPTSEASEPPHSEDDPPEKRPSRSLGLKKRVVRGFLVSIGGFGAAQALRLARNLVLTRLLFPEAFGVMILVSSVMFGLQMLSDTGFGPAVIRHEKGENQRFLDTAWTLGIIRGLILWGLACAVSPLMAAFYGEPLLLWVLPVVSAGAFIRSLASTKMFSAKRRLELGRLTVLEIGGPLVALLIMIPWALYARSIWPLAGGSLISSTFRTVLSHYVLPGKRNRLGFNREDARDLWNFGRWIIAGSSLHFVSKQGDRLLVGRLADMAALGVFGIAGQITNVLTRIGFRLSREVLFPAISTVARERRDDVRRAFYRARLRMDLTMMGGHGVVAAGAVLLVDLLYDERYSEGGWMLAILCVRSALSYTADTCQSCLVALHRLEFQVKPVAIRTVGIVIGLPLGWHLGGFEGLIWGSVISEIPPMFVLWKGLAEEKSFNANREAIGLGFFALGFVVTRGALALVPY